MDDKSIMFNKVEKVSPLAKHTSRAIRFYRSLIKQTVSRSKSVEGKYFFG